MRCNAFTPNWPYSSNFRPRVWSEEWQCEREAVREAAREVAQGQHESSKTVRDGRPSRVAETVNVTRTALLHGTEMKVDDAQPKQPAWIPVPFGSIPQQGGIRTYYLPT